MGKVLNILHVAGEELHSRVWLPPFIEALEQLGNLTLVENGRQLDSDELASLIRRHNVLITNWQVPELPLSLIDNPGQLQYICNVTGSVRKFIPRQFVEKGIPVTNWGIAPAFRIAEAAFALMLAILKDIPARDRLVRKGGWKPSDSIYCGTLGNARVGIYGFGVIGRSFEKLLRPFNSQVRVYDPYVNDFPETVVPVDSLEELVLETEILVVHAGLSSETKGSISKEILTRLPDHAVIVNTARGALFDQAALFAELESGRLRAALDVLEPDFLPEDHPARNWPNVIFTAHNLGQIKPLPGAAPAMEEMHEVCLQNITRFLDGKKLRFLVDEKRYDSST